MGFSQRDFYWHGEMKMKSAWIKDASTLVITFQSQTPHLVRWGFHPSSFQPLMTGVTEEGAVCRIIFACGRKADVILEEWQRQWPRSAFLMDQVATARIISWLEGRGKSREPAVHMTGTVFQQAVWKQMLRIPRGSVRSYAEIAARIKNPAAVRAVGTACGANPVPLIVPCHRIVGSGGRLGGFGGGLALKRQLLLAEGITGLKGLVV